MKLRNSSKWSDRFIRRMLAWCCRQVGYKVRRIVDAQFRTRTHACYSGHAYGSRRIVVSIGHDCFFPTTADTRPGIEGVVFADRLEALVAVTVHEIAHLQQYAERRSLALRQHGIIEHNARWHEVRALADFRAAREPLVSQWEAEPVLSAARSAPKLTVIEKRAMKAATDLERWKRKLTLAKNKVRKYTARVAYYAKKR